MAYVTSSTNLTVFLDEVGSLLNPMLLGELPLVDLLSKVGAVKARQLRLQMRVISHGNQRVLKDWHEEDAVVVERYSSTIQRHSSKSLNGEYFICESPSDLRLSVAKNKTQLYGML